MMRKPLGIAAILAAAASASGQSVFVLNDPLTDFEVIDMNPFDGAGDTGPFSTFNTCGLCPEGDVREMAEFDVSGIKIPEGEVVVSAVFEVQVNSIHVEGLGVQNGNTPDQMSVYGYVGNGAEDISDFGAEEFQSSLDTTSPFEGQIFAWDATRITKSVFDSGEKYVGLAVRGDEIGLIAIIENGTYPRLTIKTDADGGCYPDFTGDGALDLFDFLAYVNTFNANDLAADCTNDGTLDLFDFLCFVNAFNAGC